MIASACMLYLEKLFFYYYFFFYLEKLLEGRMHRGIGHKRQGIEWQEFSGLAQRCPSGLQVVFEMCDPVVKLCFTLHYTNRILHQTKKLFASWLKPRQCHLNIDLSHAFDWTRGLLEYLILWGHLLVKQSTYIV